MVYIRAMYCLLAIFLVKGQEFGMYDAVCQLEGLTPESLTGNIGSNALVQCTKLGAFMKQMKGTSYTFEWRYCSSNCYSKDAEWSLLAKMDGRGNIHVPNKTKYHLTEDGRLEVKNVQTDDEGIYKGKLKKTYTSPEFCFIILRVTRAPTIRKKSNSHVAFVEGNPVYLMVEADGFPVPTITWIKDGEVVKNGTFQTTFILEKAEKKDAGQYTSLVSNPNGSDNATVEVSIVAENANPTLLPKVRFTEKVDEPPCNTVQNEDPTTSHNGVLDCGTGIALWIAIGVAIGVALSIVGFCVWRKVRGWYQQRVESRSKDVAMSSVNRGADDDDPMVQA